MAELIDRWVVVDKLTALENEFQQYKPFHGFEHAMYRKLVEVEMEIGKMTAVESEPVVHAHWFTQDDSHGWFGGVVYCSACKCGDSTVRSPYCRYCGAKMDEKRMIPMYLGKCEETDCEYWWWSGDSYHDRNTECFCLLNGKSVYRHEAEEERIVCPMGKMMEDEIEYE